MRILLITHSLATGGTDRVAVHLANGFARKHETTLLSVRKATPSAGLEGLLDVPRHRRDPGRPGGVVGHGPALLENEPPELLEAQFVDEELEARGVAVLLLAEAGKDARHRLRDREQLLFREEGVEQLRLVGHRAEPAADIEGEAAVAVDDLRDGPQVVHLRQAAGLAFAAGEGGLELAAEVLGVLVAEQELRAGLGVGGDVEGLAAADAREGAGFLAMAWYSRQSIDWKA